MQNRDCDDQTVASLQCSGQVLSVAPGDNTDQGTAGYDDSSKATCAQFLPAFRYEPALNIAASST